ncbi:hypothetical protein [Streptomyces chattanoogensis]|uniref:hypothetical protein n=1 Tax=Streptomyces chattanoogensis TaxID=66876 RepID=UPI0006B4E550|nr:hypothetical protein [Streptomyces chattanoogensis]
MPATKARTTSPASPEPPAGPLRNWLAAFPFIAAIATIAGVYAGVSGRLPEPLGTHFNGTGGHIDGYTSAHGFLTWNLVELLVLGIVLGVFVYLRRTAPGTRWVIALGWGLAAAFGYLSCVTLLINVDVTDAADVRLPLWRVAVGLAGALLCGALGWLLAGPDRRPSDRRPAGHAERLALGRGETAGWSRSVGSPLVAALAVVTLCAALVIGFLGDRLVAGSLLVAAVVIGAIASVRVTVDRRGLALASTLVPYPFRRIPLDRVEEATSRRVDPLTDFGGWGYRTCPGRSGLVLRSGDGLVLRLTNGREFVVTVDDAATAAALFNTCLDRAREQ